MEVKDALKVANDFLQYLRTEDETKIDQYTKTDLNSAIALFQPYDRS